MFQKKVKLIIQLTFQLPKFSLFMIFWFRKARAARSNQKPWVISGHKGILYEDNSRALHEYILRSTNQEIIWISDSNELTCTLRGLEYKVLEKHSLLARIIILEAPVLIYSHGEDDLDNFMFLWRRWLGVRILLRHGLTHLKKFRNISKFRKTDFDWMLACSHLERENFISSLDNINHKVILGGGAHLDRFLQNKNISIQRQILFFPTHRDTPSEKFQLNEVIKKFCSSSKLYSWLVENDYRLVIGRHVNSDYDAFSLRNDRISFLSPDQLFENLIKSEILISDYSAVQCAYLLLDKPILHFPFDLESYTRSLFMEYDDFAYGPIVRNFEDLEICLTEWNWRSTNFMQRDKRERLKGLFFPFDEPKYAKASYEAICSVIKGTTKN